MAKVLIKYISKLEKITLNKNKIIVFVCMQIKIVFAINDKLFNKKDEYSPTNI